MALEVAGKLADAVLVGQMQSQGAHAKNWSEYEMKYTTGIDSPTFSVTYNIASIHTDFDRVYPTMLSDWCSHLPLDMGPNLLSCKWGETNRISSYKTT